MPEISIITPCYNSARFLSETISSVQAQAFGEWEWLITDDGSTDNSIEILHAIQDPRIQVSINTKNMQAAPEMYRSKKQPAGILLFWTLMIIGNRVFCRKWCNL